MLVERRPALGVPLHARGSLNAELPSQVLHGLPRHRERVSSREAVHFRNGTRYPAANAVNTGEIRGGNAVGLHPQELPPAGPVAARSGIAASSPEDQSHGTGCDLIAKPGEFAVDASITPTGVLHGQP